MLVQGNYLFKGLDEAWWRATPPSYCEGSKLYASQPIYTAFRVNRQMFCIITTGGPVIIRSTPLDRVIGISYSGSCFGMRSLPLATVGESWFPKSGRSYKTADVIKIPLEAVQGFTETGVSSATICY